MTKTAFHVQFISLALFLSNSNCLAQIQFSDLIESGIERRAKIDAYAFDYMMMNRRIEKEDGKSETILITFEEGSIFGIPEKNLWYTKRRDEIIDYNGRLPEEKEGDIGQFSPLKGREVHTIHRNGTSYTVFRGSMEPRPKVRNAEKALSHPFEPFDYRSLGLATAGDIFAGEQYEKICSNYRSFPGTNVEFEMLSGDKEGVAQARFGPLEIDFALDKDYWIVSNKMTLSKRVLGSWVKNVTSHTEVELVQKFGNWWPKYANVRGKNISMEVFLEWHDPKTVNESRFELASLLEVAMSNADIHGAGGLRKNFEQKREDRKQK